jgi:hypothetical protein
MTCPKRRVRKLVIQIFIYNDTVVTLYIGPWSDLTELSGKFSEIDLIFYCGFIEVKIEQRCGIGKIPCNLMQGEFDRLMTN